MKLGLNEFSAKDAINKLDQKDLEKYLSFLEKKKKPKKLLVEL